MISEAQNPNSGRRPEFAKIFGSEAPKKGKNGPVGRGDTGAGRGFVSWGLPGPDPAALKGATGRIGKIPTYVKRSRALKSARSFSPKFRAGRRRVSPTPSPTSTNPANVCLTRPGAPAPPLEPFLGVRISEHPKSRTCIEKPVLIMGRVRARAARRHTNKWTSPTRGRRRFREAGHAALRGAREQGRGPAARPKDVPPAQERRPADTPSSW